MLFSLLLFNEFQWNLAGAERVLCPFILLIVRTVRQRSRSQLDKTQKVVNARICKWHDILYIIIAQCTVHTFFKRDNKPRNLPSIFLDVSTENSVDEPCKVTIWFEGRPPCRFPYRFNSSYYMLMSCFYDQFCLNLQWRDTFKDWLPFFTDVTCPYGWAGKNFGQYFLFHVLGELIYTQYKM